MESILSIYQNIREDSSHPNPEEKIKHMINHNGSGGWNALHFAIYLAHQNVVKDLLDRWTNYCAAVLMIAFFGHIEVRM